MAAVERLSAVSDELEACGSEAAESRVRRILGGLGFSAQMMEACSTRLSGGGSEAHLQTIFTQGLGQLGLQSDGL
eukprot:SAG11_NODE_574_length_8430_cov_11.461769_7_plen_75_part_00